MEKSLMPVYDFKCQNCKVVKEESIKWSEDMADKLDLCECGAKNWKRLYTFAQPKLREIGAEERETEQMCDSKWY